MTAYRFPGALWAITNATPNDAGTRQRTKTPHPGKNIGEARLSDFERESIEQSGRTLQGDPVPLGMLMQMHALSVERHEEAVRESGEQSHKAVYQRAHV